MSSSFLRNFWYAAAWPQDVTRQPARHLFLNEAVVMYRLDDGSFVALADICPHRFVPLSRGKLVGDQIECAYHGLRFDRDGKCSHNPHGDGAIPNAAQVRTYPLVEQHGMLWIWMGEPARADIAAIPNFSVLTDSAYAMARGTTFVEANVDLIVDNLLDLSHVQFLHPQLRSPSTEEVVFRQEFRQDGKTIWAMRWRDSSLPNGLQQMFWPKEKIGDTRAHMRWDAPSNLYLDVGITECGQPPEAGVVLPVIHLLTPATETSTHYFWAFLRNRKIDDHELTDRIRSLGIQAFENEDKPIIEAQQENASRAEALALRQVLLKQDTAAVRVKRLLAEIHAAEAV